MGKPITGIGFILFLGMSGVVGDWGCARAEKDAIGEPGNAPSGNFIPEINTVALSPQGRTLLVAATTSSTTVRAVFWRDGQVYWQWDFPHRVYEPGSFPYLRGYLASRNPFLNEDTVGFLENGPHSQVSCSFLRLSEKKPHSLGEGTWFNFPVVDSVAGRLWLHDFQNLRDRQRVRFLSWSTTGQYVEVALPGLWSMEAAAGDWLYLDKADDSTSPELEEKERVVYRFKLVPTESGWELEQGRSVYRGSLRDVLVWSPQGKYVGRWRNSLGPHKPSASESLECYSLETDPWHLVFKLDGAFTSWAFDEARESAVIGVSMPDGAGRFYVADLREGTLSPISLSDLAAVYSWQAEAKEMVASKSRKNGRFWLRLPNEEVSIQKRVDLVKIRLRNRDGWYEEIREEPIPWAVAPAPSGEKGDGAGRVTSDRVSAEARRHYETGLACKRAGKYYRAVTELQQALELHGDYEEAHWALAWTYVAQGKKEPAIVEFHTVAWLAGENERGRESRAALSRLGGTVTTPHIALVEEILSTPEDRLRLTPMILRLCQIHDPQTPMGKFQQQLEEMAAELQRRFGAETRPESLLRVMREYLFEELHFQSVPPEQAPRWEHWLPSVTLATGKGSCQSLSLLLLCLGEQLGLPLYGVEVPDHFFVRYDDGTTRTNLETTASGALWVDELYRMFYRIPPGEAPRQVFLTSLSKQETIASFLHTLGDWLWAQARIREAIVVYQQALRLRPQDYRLYDALGGALFQQWELEATQLAYQQALRINPQDAEAHVGLGGLFACDLPWTSEPREAAVREYQAALQIDPNHAGAHHGLGVLWHCRGKYAEAVREYRAALQVNPQNYEARVNLALSLQCQGKTAEADRELQTALQTIRKNPDPAQVHFDLAMAYLTMGRHSKMREEHAALQGLNPDLAELFNRRYLSPPPPPPPPQR